MHPGEVVLEGLAAVGRKALPDVGRKLEAGRLELRDELLPCSSNLSDYYYYNPTHQFRDAVSNKPEQPKCAKYQPKPPSAIQPQTPFARHYLSRPSLAILDKNSANSPAVLHVTQSSDSSLVNFPYR